MGKFKEDEKMRKQMPEPPDQDMIFPEDMFYDDQTVPLYDKGKTYKVPGRMVDRWLMRGGVIVGDTAEQHVPIDPVLAAEHLKNQKADDSEKAKADADAARAEEAKAKAAAAEKAEADEAKADAEKKPAAKKNK